jgi:hypothetical protein
MKTSYAVYKIEGKKYYFVINTQQSGQDLGLATGHTHTRTYDLGAPYLSLYHIILLC